MLAEIHIHNFAIIDRLKLCLKDRMSVFTGETGAGKSILVEALGLVLGDRAQSVMVRPNHEFAEVVAIFDLARAPALNESLKQHISVHGDDELIIKRQINANGRSRAYLNDSPISQRALQQLGDRLVDIHGQHAHQSLLRNDIQRDVLDTFADHQPLLDATGAAYREWKDASTKLEELISGAGLDRDAEIDLLRYQVDELRTIDFEPAEQQELEQEHLKLSNVKQLIEGCQRVLHMLENDDGGASSVVGQAGNEVRQLQSFEPRLASIADLLHDATIQIDEAVTQTRHYLSGLEIDPQRLETVERRLETLHDIARKHGAEIEHLPETLTTLTDRLNTLESNDEKVRQLRATQEKAIAAYTESAQTLHKSRMRCGESLADQISANIQKLGMSGGELSIAIQQTKDPIPFPKGNDRVEFLITTNPGLPPRPLNKIASGGELSRVGLAIQVVARQNLGAPTLVFDEVDAGIGGGTAEIVGQQLRQLSERFQVLCVTHLPQVASHGQHHFRVTKNTKDNETLATVESLQRKERVGEIARMLGGLEITEQTLAHAREMLCET